MNRMNSLYYLKSVDGVVELKIQIVQKNRDESTNGLVPCLICTKRQSIYQLKTISTLRRLSSAIIRKLFCILVQHTQQSCVH